MDYVIFDEIIEKDLQNLVAYVKNNPYISASKIESNIKKLPIGIGHDFDKNGTRFAENMPITTHIMWKLRLLQTRGDIQEKKTGSFYATQNFTEKFWGLSVPYKFVKNIWH